MNAQQPPGHGGEGRRIRVLATDVLKSHLAPVAPPASTISSSLNDPRMRGVVAFRVRQSRQGSPPGGAADGAGNRSQRSRKRTLGEEIRFYFSASDEYTHTIPFGVTSVLSRNNDLDPMIDHQVSGQTSIRRRYFLRRLDQLGYGLKPILRWPNILLLLLLLLFLF